MGHVGAGFITVGLIMDGLTTEQQLIKLNTAEPDISSFLFQRMNNITVFITLVISGVWMFTKRGEVVGTLTQILLLILRENSTTFTRTVTDNWTSLGLSSVREDVFSKKKHHQWILKKQRSLQLEWLQRLSEEFYGALSAGGGACNPSSVGS